MVVVFGRVSKWGGTVFSHVSFEIGDGTCIRFWHVRWCGNLPLKVLYPDLFVCATDKDFSNFASLY